MRLLPAFFFSAICCFAAGCGDESDDVLEADSGSSIVLPPLDLFQDSGVTPIVDAGLPETCEMTGGTLTPPTSFKLATYNLQNLFDVIDDPNVDENEFTPGSTWTASKLEARKARFKDVFTDIDADVIGVLEAENLEILTELRDYIRDHGGPNYPYIALARGKDGLARGIDVSLLSKYPLICPYTANSTGCSRPITRTFECMGEDGMMTVDANVYTEAKPILHSEIDFNGDGIGDFLVLVNHWKAKDNHSWPCLDSNDNHRRAGMQIRELLDQLIAQKPCRPIAILGDFNTWDFEPAMMQDIGTILDASKLTKATDVYNTWGERGVSASHTSNSNSWNNISNSSYNFNNVWSRLDHILLTGNVREGGESDWRVVKGSTQSIHPGYLLDSDGTPSAYNVYTGKGYSDHLAVRVELKRN